MFTSLLVADVIIMVKNLKYDNSRILTISELWIRLEAYTLSNRGRSLRIVIIAKTTGWKSVPKHIIAECGTGFQPAVRAWSLPVGKMLTHFPTALKVLASSQSSCSLLNAHSSLLTAHCGTGFQPEPLLTTQCSQLLAHC